MQFKAIVVVLLVLLFSGCGGGSDTGGSDPDTPIGGVPADPAVADIVAVEDNQNSRIYTFSAVATPEQASAWSFQWRILNASGGVLAEFSDVADIQYEFAQDGNYTVELTVIDADAVAHTDTFDVVIASQNNNAPNADISASGDGFLWTFDASGSTDADNDNLSYVWTIGTLATLNGETVEYTFANTGEYQITLTVSDGQTQDTETTAINISAQNATPIPSFTLEQNGLVVGVNASASIDSDGTIEKYSWDFNGAVTKVGITSFHLFDTPGSKEITLTVTDSNGALQSLTKTVVLSVIQPENRAPVAQFTHVVNELLVTFSNASSDADGDNLTYDWNFGDGSSSAIENLSHTYAATGTYNVVLTVSDGQVSSMLTLPVSVVASNQAPVAQFSHAKNDLTVTFTNTSIDADGEDLTYAWDFGDGATSTQRNPSHTYANADSYRVALSVSDGNVSDTSVVFVTVTAANQVPTAQFSHTVDDLTATFTSNATDDDGDALTYTWSFGDGSASQEQNPSHTYASAGTYAVELIVSDGQDTSVPFSKSISVAASNQAPTASFSYSADFLSISFNASASADPDEGTTLSYNWDFGDGASSTLENPTHTYASEDTYMVTLTVSDGALSDGETQSVVVSSEPVDADPVARFVVSAQTDLSVTVDASTSSDNEDESSALTYTWNFNDEATRTGSIVTYEFATEGQKTITLTVKDNAENENSVSDSVTVTAPSIDLLTYVVTNVIGGDINCAQCHVSGGVAGITNLIFAEQTNDAVEAAIVSFIELDNPSNVQKLKDKPSNVVIHGGGNKFNGFGEEKQRWEELIDQIAATLAVPSDPEASFTFTVVDFTVQVDASSTIEGSDALHTYEWSVDNGVTASGKTADLDLTSAGEYIITLTVTDTSSNRTDTTFNVVNIENQTASANCADNTLSTCFDFEDGLPSELEGQGNADRTIDTTTGYNSDASVKLTTTAFNDAKFFNIPVPSTDFWARVFIKSSGDEGEYASSWGGDIQGFARPHGTLIRGRDGAAQMRIGDHRCQLEINRDQGAGHLGDDLEMTSGSYGDNDTVCEQDFGARMEIDTWYCLEVHFNGPDSEIQVFWDNQNVEQLHVTEERTWTNADKPPGGPYSQNSDQPWGPYDYDTFEFGYENYEGSGPTQPNGQKPKPTITYWYDGVATHTERVGCGDDYVSNASLDPSTKLGVDDNGYPYNGSSGGGNPTPTPTPTPDPIDVGDGTIIFAEDFESYSVDSYPGDWGYYINYQTNLSHSPETLANAIKVTDTEVNSGNRALHLTNTSQQEPVQITRVLDTDLYSDRVFLRMYIKQSVDLGRSPANNHATLVGLRGVTGQSETEVRFGDAKGVLGINIVPTDGISPVYEKQASQLSEAELAAAPLITKDEWHCLELAFLDDGAESQVYAWNDGDLVFSVESRDDFAPGGPSEPHWLAEQFHEVMIGWQSWLFGSSDAINENIWVDDIVASTERVGCI